MSDNVELTDLVDPATAGVLVVDAQEKLLNAVHDGDAVGRTVAAAVRGAGLMKLPILATEQYPRGLGHTVSAVQAALDEFGAAPPMEKTSFSCFGAPAFSEAAAQHTLDTLAICGVETHVCVLQTAMEARGRGMNVFVVSDATGSRNPTHKAEALLRMKDAGCIVGPLEMFLFEIMRDAKHPAFRDVQRIIR